MKIEHPLTEKILSETVITSDGFSYEVDAIESWMIKNNYISVEYIDNIDIIDIHIMSKQFENLLKYKNYDFAKWICRCTFDIFVRECKNLEIIKYVIDNIIDIECEDRTNFRPIHIACSNNNLDMVKYLVSIGVNLECEHIYKWRPIHLACYRNNLSMLKCLVEKGVNLECENNNKQKPIHLACKNNNLDMVKYLVEKGVDLECEDIDKNRPIYYAYWHKNPDMINYLTKKM